MILDLLWGQTLKSMGIVRDLFFGVLPFSDSAVLDGP